MEADVQAGTADLRRLVGRFRRWRGARSRGERIPEALWASATDLAREEGVSPVARALVLDYYRLKERVEASGSRVSTVDSPNFVELAVDSATRHGGHEIEVIRKDGARLLIHPSSGNDFDLRELVLAFLETSR